MAVLTRVKSHILMDVTSHVRITDFGLSTVTRNLDSMQDTSDERGYSVRWTAPEILEGKVIHSKEADVFSFAMVMIEVRYEWIIRIEPWLTVISDYHRYLPGQFRLAGTQL